MGFLIFLVVVVLAIVIIGSLSGGKDMGDVVRKGCGPTLLIILVLGLIFFFILMANRH